MTRVTEYLHKHDEVLISGYEHYKQAPSDVYAAMTEIAYGNKKIPNSWEKEVRETVDENRPSMTLRLEDIPREVKDIRIKQLQLKLAEYEQRMDELLDKNGYPQVELDGVFGSLLYKRDILRILLDLGELDAISLKAHYFRKGSYVPNLPDGETVGGPDGDPFDSAFSVIKGYFTKGENAQFTQAGTGLPKVE